MNFIQNSHKPLKIGIVARLLADGSMRGWNRYAVNLIAELARSGEAEILLLTDAPVAMEHRLIFDQSDIRSSIREIASGSMPYPKWQEWWLPRAARCEKIDVIHTPFHFGLPFFAPCPTVATLHDAIDVLQPEPFKERIRLKSLLSRFYLWEARRRASKIITVSYFSANDLTNKLKIPAHKIVVIPEAADPIFFQKRNYQEENEILRSYPIGPGYYVFYVGGLESRKNLGLAIRALARIRNPYLKLVLAGGSKSDAKKLADLAENQGVADRVIFLGRVPDSHLPALYSNALGLVYPSRWEGFGLQLVEAMAVGCPVLASSAASLPEVLQDGGETFSPDDPDSLAELLDRLCGDQLFLHEMQHRSQQRGFLFSWEETARLTLKLYRELVSK